MARIRTIKPEMWESEKLGKLSALARLSFVGLISMSDDHGYGRGGTSFLFGRLHPYATNTAIKHFDSALKELQNIGVAIFYEADGCWYYSLPGWDDNQYIEKKKESKIPRQLNNSPTNPLLIPSEEGMQCLRKGREGKGREGIGEQDRAGKPHFTPPTVQEIKAYCIERKNSINPQDFHDHYETRGWIPKGYTKQMKSWQAAVRTWEKYDKKSKPTNDGFMKAEDYLILEGSNDPA